MYMRSRSRREDLRLRISGFIQGDGEEREERLEIFVRSSA